MPPRPDSPDRITRGKTAPNRLRRVDAFLATYDPVLLRRRDGAYAAACVVDLGYGAEPVTTLEMAARLRRVSAGLPVVGVEIDPERVARAQPCADALTRFVEGGFDLPVGPVRLLRAFNVLRQYEEAEAAPILARLVAQVLPGGLVVDGTSDPYGRVWTASVLRRGDAGRGEGGGGGSATDAGATPGGADAATLEALVLGTNFRGGLEPEAFQTRLPKSFIHRVVPGDPVGAFIEAWKASCRDTRASEVWGPRAWFTAAAGALTARGWAVMRPDSWPRRGWLVVREPGLPLVR